MSKHRQAAKVDNSQTSIVRDLRKIPGLIVEVGHDDVLIGYKDRTYWYDLKNPEDVSKKTGEIRPSKLTDNDKRRLRDYTGHFKIVWSIEQILKEMGIVNN
jgi:hypothetical protein